MLRIRRLGPLSASLAVVLATSGLALWVTADATKKADAVHRRDSQAHQVALGGLTTQFFQLSFKEAFEAASARRWSLVPGNEADRQALAAFNQKSALLRDAALLTDLRGTVLNANHTGPLPEMTDPAFAPMRTALLAGKPGLSGVLHTDAGPMVAMAVPVMEGATPKAVFIGLFRPETSPLQSYVETLDTGMTPLVTDSTGAIVVHGDRDQIGGRISDGRFQRQLVKAEGRFIEFDRAGTRMAASVAPLGVGGWAAMSEVPARDFYAVTRSGEERTQWALLGILVAAALALVTLNHRTAATRRRGEKHFRALVQNSTDAITVIEADGTIVYESPAVERLLGFEPTGRIGKSAFDYLHADDTVATIDSFGALLSTPDAEFRRQLRVKHADGGFQWFEIQARNLLHDPAVKGIVVNSRDITERRRLDEHLQHLATHDELTDLPNRALFAQFMAAATGARDESAGQVAVLFLDLDRFKVVNDTFGHEVGDRLLIAVSHRLRAVLRANDVLARISGDEFAILLDGVADVHAAEHVATRIIDDFREGFLLGENEVYVGISIGVAMADPKIDDGDLMIHADIAMYRAKQKGRLRFETFVADMGQRARQRLELEADLRRAIDRDEFVLHFQPEISMADGTITGFEALVRWNHPTRGLLLPGQFISLAEETGLIRPLGEWVLETACRQSVLWESRGGDGRRMNVNLSGRQLQRGAEFVDTVSEILERTGANPSLIVLEITESVLMDDAENAIVTLTALRDLGLELAIDDFGTGYSSLAYLKDFPVSSLKLDRSFVHGLADDSSDRAIAAAMIGLAHALGLQVTAEGVELLEQDAELRRLGCDRAQGFLFAVPLESVAAAGLFENPRLAGRTGRRSGGLRSPDHGQDQG